MPNIIVDKDLCIKCNTCALVCVMGIIKPATDSSFPRMLSASEASCMKCGHCEAFCPEKALVLDYLPEEKIGFDIPDSVIETQKLALYMKKRRSVRYFTNQPVSRETITELLGIARYAPTGGNSQMVKWTVIYDTTIVKQIAELTVDWMRTIQGTSHPLASYVPIIIKGWEMGMDPICRNAPHLLYTHLPINPFIDDRTDAIIATTYVDLAAPAFGIGTCWAGFIRMAADSYQPLQEAMGLPEGRKVGYPLFFGYPKYPINAIPRRNPLDITWR